MHSLQGKWVLITGASRGIGLLISLFMARHGCNLVLHSRKLEHTSGLLKQVAELGVQAYSVEADLANPLAVNSMLDEIQQRATEIDIVFNNAAIQVEYRKDFWKTPVSDFNLSFQVNFIAAAMICYRLVPNMQQRDFGRIINITSGIINEPEQAAYSASKAALDKFSRDLASKLDGSNVLLNLADPGWCRTDLGGPQAPNLPQSSLPGVVVAAFIDDKKSGRLFQAQEFHDMTLRDAVRRAESNLLCQW